MDPGGTEPSHTDAAGRTVGAAMHDQDIAVRLVDDQSLAVDTDMLTGLARHALRGVGVRDMQVDVTLVDDDRMAALNREHLDGDGPTDVLAFPLDAPGQSHAGVPAMLGDVVIAPAVAERQAEVAGHTVDAELQVLLVHGLLHLLGHDHADEVERRVMFGLTDDLLASFRRRRPGRSGPGAAQDLPS